MNYNINVQSEEDVVTDNVKSYINYKITKGEFDSSTKEISINVKRKDVTNVIRVSFNIDDKQYSITNINTDVFLAIDDAFRSINFKMKEYEGSKYQLKNYGIETKGDKAIIRALGLGLDSTIYDLASALAKKPESDKANKSCWIPISDDLHNELAYQRRLVEIYCETEKER